jgi:ABC-type Fe3+/spermidine/putrescine transport system ATPase subunit
MEFDLLTSKGHHAIVWRRTTNTSGRLRSEFINLSKRFGGQQILANISFDIAAGEVLVVLGPSGSGKTTLLRIIAGLEEPETGEIHLNGQVAQALPPQKRELGVVFQEHALFQRKTVEQNIAFGLETRKLARIEKQKIVDEMLSLVNLRAMSLVNSKMAAASNCLSRIFRCRFA